MKNEIFSAVLYMVLFLGLLMKSYGVTTSVIGIERRCELNSLPSLMGNSTC